MRVAKRHIIVRQSCPFVLVPIEVGENCWRFTERGDAAGVREAVLRLHLAMYVLFVIVTAAIVIGASSNAYGGIEFRAAVLLVLAVCGAMLVWLWNTSRRRASRHRLVTIQPGQNHASLVVRDRVGQCESVCCTLNEVEFRISRVAGPSGLFDGVCVTVRFPTLGAEGVVPLAVTRSSAAAERYVRQVLGSIGVQCHASECEVLRRSIWGLRPLRSENGLFFDVTACAKCRYDLSGSEAERCPECGERRGFVPRMRLGEEA